MTHAILHSCGAYLPSNIMTNDDVAKIVETNDEWIRERTGITQRHIAAEGEFTSDLATAAAKAALEKSSLTLEDIDLIIVATTTPDRTFPSTATIVQHKLGMKHGAAFDIQAVCSGFIYGLSIADNFIRSGQHKHIIVIGAETMSRIIDWKDRSTCILFGDGAGAVIVSASDTQHNPENRGILSTHLYSDGSYLDMLYMDGGASTSSHVGLLHMEGKEVFRHAVDKMRQAILTSLEVNNLTKEDIDWIIPHQANLRIMEFIRKKLRAPQEKLISTVPIHANTSAASIPLALAETQKTQRIKEGDLLSFTALGGGLTWGSVLLRW